MLPLVRIEVGTPAILLWCSPFWANLACARVWLYKELKVLDLQVSAKFVRKETTMAEVPSSILILQEVAFSAYQFLAGKFP